MGTSSLLKISLSLKENKVRFRTRLTFTSKWKSLNKNWKNGKDKLKSKMENVSISFSGRSGGGVGTSLGGKLPRDHGFESRSDYRSSPFVLSV